MTLEFDSLEWTYFTNLGWVVTVKFDGTPENWNPGEMVNQFVEVDGWKFMVRGVEMTRQMISPSHPYRGTIGLLT